jgi:hypothetical protein
MAGARQEQRRRETTYPCADDHEGFCAHVHGGSTRPDRRAMGLACQRGGIVARSASRIASKLSDWLPGVNTIIATMALAPQR